MDEKTLDIIRRFKEVHGNTYGYDKVNYIGWVKNVLIYCKVHNKYFEQTPANHMKGRGCKECGIERRAKKKLITPEVFIQRCKEIHGGKYDYSKTNYIDLNTEVIVTCPIHGDFLTKPHNHLYGKGCQLCGFIRNKNIVRNKEQFLDKVTKLYGDKYDYSDVKYNGTYKPVKIHCNLHNIVFVQAPKEFYKTPNCPKCKSIHRKSMTTEEFISKCIEVHGDKYDYNETVFDGLDSDITYICKYHGKVTQKATGHLYSKYGCAKCGEMSRTLTTEEFVYKAKQIHGNTYGYSKTKYTGYHNKVIITCSIHGDFEKEAGEHIRINRGGNGCPICTSSIPEQRIYGYLKSINMSFKRQYQILEPGQKYKFDFYLDKLNILIEYHGIQHYTPVKIWGGIEGYNKRLMRDKAKVELAKKHNIPLITIKYDSNDIIDDLMRGISKYYKYKVGNTYIKTFKDLKEHLNLNGDATPNDVKKYLT